MATKTAQKLREEGSVLSHINELITLAVERGRGPSAVTGHRYSEYLKGLEKAGEEERRRKKRREGVPALTEKEKPAQKTAVVPIPITEEALKATYSLAAALERAKSGKSLEWLV